MTKTVGVQPLALSLMLTLESPPLIGVKFNDIKMKFSGGFSWLIVRLFAWYDFICFLFVSLF